MAVATSLPAEQVSSVRVGKYVDFGMIAVDGDSVVITSLMAGGGVTVGGTDVVPGCVTSGGQNYVMPFIGYRRIYSGGYPVYGRQTVEGGVGVGVVSVSARGVMVVGSGTSFTDYAVGQWIRVVGGLDHFWTEIASIEDDEHMTLAMGYRGTSEVGVAYEVGDWVVRFYVYMPSDGEVAVEVVGEVQLHGLKSELPMRHIFLESIFDPRYEVYSPGGISRIEYLTDEDFSYDGELGVSRVTLAYTPRVDVSGVGALKVFINGVLDTKYVGAGPVEGGYREYMMDGDVLVIAGDVSSGSSDAPTHVTVCYLSDI